MTGPFNNIKYIRDRNLMGFPVSSYSLNEISNEDLRKIPTHDDLENQTGELFSSRRLIEMADY